MYRWFRKMTFSAALLLAGNSFATIFDGGVDSANLGKGDWIYFMSAATNQLGGNVPSVTNIASFMAFEKSQGINYIIVKAGTGSTNFNGDGSSPQFTSNLVAQAHAVGLKIFGYTRSYGSDVPGEINVASYCFNRGADGFVLDAEAEWENNQPWIGSNGPSLALQLGQGIKNLWPTKFLAHSPMPIISFHPSFPYKEFGFYCDTVMPQIYHFSFDMTPSAAIDWTDTEFRNFHNSLTGTWTNSIKPLAPVGQVYGPLAPPDAATIPDNDVTEFVDYLAADPNAVTAGGYKGVNFWRADLHGAVQWANIKASTSGDMPGIVNNIVIDNPTATVVGSWTTSALATNKFGNDYRYKGSGTGAAYVQFTPNIVTAGNYKIYEWHTVGSNRSVGAPFQISYNGGTTTVNVDQQSNDAQWVLLGTFNFATGTGGFIRLLDTHADTTHVVVADGLKLVYSGPPPPPPIPAAPSGLTATPVRATRIDLAWTDNSNNEANFVVLRSLTAGGPYSTITTLPADTTGFTNTGLLASTTYYYVVRASNASGSSANSNEASATTPESDLLIDNTSAAIVGAWSVGTQSADKYGADYRYITQGTGANSLKFTPFISTAAAYDVFEWHPQGSNRTTNALHVITHSAGSTTVGINQEVNGGKWNRLGTFDLATGTAGNVKITDNFPEATQVVMADAIKFVQAPAPVAASGLTATAVNSSRINLNWTDNSTNETSFVIARSTTSGGPYTDLATVAAGTTTFANTGIAANTTYYYVVRAKNGTGSSANTAQASATTFKAVHVSSITMSWVFSSGTKFKSRAVVNVKDSAGVNVNSATVTGNYTGSISESGKTGVTTSGNATFTSTAAITSGTVTFTVTDISGAGMTYVPGANVVTSATHSR
ncbi:MAG: hypothetical protein JWM68_1188 [Verrucomicrobiales bacterium]|nr:hypothetical protein [Verrucomicrobiales bacterium]